MGTLININDKELLNELYVGETNFIEKLIGKISEARAPYVGRHMRAIKGNKDLLEIGDMISKEFGFYSCTFQVILDSSLNAFCYPITKNIDKSVLNIKPNFVKKTGFKYDQDKVGRLCTLIAVTSGIWFNDEITDREIVALILHEVGHSFTIQSESIIDMTEIIRIFVTFQILYKTFFDITTIFNSDNTKKKMHPIKQDVKNIIFSSNKGKEIINKVSRELANNKFFVGFNEISAIVEWINFIPKQIIKELYSLTNGFAQIIAIPFSVISNILSKIFKQPVAFFRSQEYLSDSFATMYGLGPELSSALVKMEYSPSASGSKIEKLIAKTPLGAIQQAMTIPMLYLLNTANTHPSTPARMNKIINELEKELQSSDLDPKTKSQLKKDIQELNNIKDEALRQDDIKSLKNAESVKRAWLNFLNNNESINDYEDYYTDLDDRNKYMKESAHDPIDNIKLI